MTMCRSLTPKCNLALLALDNNKRKPMFDRGKPNRLSDNELTPRVIGDELVADYLDLERSRGMLIGRKTFEDHVQRASQQCTGATLQRPHFDVAESYHTFPGFEHQISSR